MKKTITENLTIAGLPRTKKFLVEGKPNEKTKFVATDGAGVDDLTTHNCSEMFIDLGEVKNMSENSIKTVMDTTMDKLRTMVDADTIIGTPIVVGNITLLPVSRVSFGLATGGSDFPNKNGQELFGGGGGAGVTVSPIAFMAISNGNVKMIPVYNELTTLEKAVTMAPEIIDKAKELFPKKEKEIK